MCWALELERSKWSGGGKIHWEVGVGSHFLGFSRFGRERGALWSLEESEFLQRDDEGVRSQQKWRGPDPESYPQPVNSRMRLTLFIVWMT